MHDVEHLSIYIDRAPGDVYEYASDPRNLPRWASGLANSEVEQDGGDWIVEASFGKVKVRFAERNTFGVMDHDVTLGSGVTMHNPMRVVPHGDGSEFIFTLIRRVGMSDEEFAQDRATIEKDLKTLKAILEGSALTR
jgi:carbon monoxide dehydrogenase subunit G